MAILSVYGSKDAFVNESKIEESKKNLLSRTYYIKIEGMNHRDFGSYGLQSGDKESSLDNESARKLVAEEVMGF